MLHHWRYFFFVSGLLLMGCRKPDQHPAAILLDERHKVTLPDSLLAARVITTDTTCGYFDQVGLLDMSIQLKNDYPVSVGRDKVLEDYLQFWKTEVMEFSPEERKMMTGILQEAWTLVSRISPDIFPSDLQLIKIRGNAYGPGVFFTRENAIVIPASDLQPDRSGNLLEVMLHEIFHVYSRRHPEKRDALYRLIGFEKLPVAMEELVMDSTLKQSLLRNPDAMDISYAIRLAPETGDTVRAIPVFYAESPAYDPSRRTFFEYATFHLFAVNPDGMDRYAVSAAPLSFAYNEAYYARITDNTGYVIHPEEIMADNFALLAMSKMSGDSGSLDMLSEAGKTLVRRVEAVLRE